MLAVFLPLAFVAGIAARKPVPDTPPLTLPKSSAAVWERSGLFTNAAIKLRLARESSDGYAVELSAAKDFLKPDLLVYWAAGASEIAGSLPDNAQLIGAFVSSAPLRLPPNALSVNGRVFLYSLADQEIVDASKPFAIQKP